MDLRSLAVTGGVVVAVVASVAVVWWLDRPGGAWTRRLRSRLLLGVPWGTLLVVGVVLGFYLVAQRGWWAPTQPLTLPFTSWSYLYPLGVVTAPFAHANLGHVTGNLVATLVLAPVAEYAWSHFPTGRGSQSFASWRTNPYVRALVLFPLGVLLVGLGTSLLAWGPVIGFSGVVFAFAGFALTRYPIATVVALSARSLVSLLYSSLQDPVVVASSSPSYGPPWWVGVAVQAHLLGFLLGAVLGAVLIGRRGSEERPSALRLWGGTLLVAVSLTLWALWWYRGPATFVLYRGLGVVLVLALGVLLAIGVRARARPLVSHVELGVTRRQIGIAVLLLPLVTMAFVAVPLNLATVADDDPSGEGVTVRDYTVTYAEDVPNRRAGAVDVSVFNETTDVNASGVLVTSPTRHLWTERISTGELAYWGRGSVVLGDVGWRTVVDVEREGWNVAGGETAYVVRMRGTGDWKPVYASESVTADLAVANRTIRVVPREGSFTLRVRRDDASLGETALPGENRSVNAGGLTFVRDDRTILAVRNGTRVAVAAEETYQ